MGEHPEQRLGIAAGIAAYVVWGLLTIYWKQLHRFDAFELIGWRITSAAIVMVIVLAATRGWSQLTPLRHDPVLRRRVLGSALLLTTNWTAYVWAVVHDHVLETALGYFIAPIGTVSVGVLLLGEHLRRAQRIALGFAVASVVVLTVSYGSVPWLALLIAASWTWYGYLKKSVPLTPVAGMAAESFVLVVPAVAVAVVMAGRADSIPSSADRVELAYAFLTGVATVLPLILFAYAAQRMPLSMIGPMQYIVPSMNFLIGWLLYDEELPVSRWIGFGLVWIGLAVLTADSARRLHAARTGAASPATVG